MDSFVLSEETNATGIRNRLPEFSFRVDIHYTTTHNLHLAPSPVIVDGQITDKEVDNHVYPGKTIARYGAIFPELKRRIVLGWKYL